jgi:glutathione S-transferase
MKERLVRPAFGAKPDQEFIDSAREPLALQMRVIDAAVAARDFLVGDRLTIADAFLLPHFLFFGITLEGKALLEKAPAASAWLARMRQRPSFSISPMARMFDAMSMIKQTAA